MSQQSWPPANLSHNAKDNKALQRHFCLFRESSRTMTSQGRSENSDQSGPLHPMLSNADPLVHGSTANLDAKNGSKGSPLNKTGKQNELIDLFEEISAEQLLIEPREMSTDDVGPFNHAKWLEKLAQNVREEEKVPNAYKW